MATPDNSRRRAVRNLRAAPTVERLDHWFAECLLAGVEVVGPVPGAAPFTIHDAYRLRRYGLEHPGSGLGPLG